MESVEMQVFPAESFREGQYETLRACLDALDNGYKNIVIDAPVGTGKSLICTALLNYVENGFYTTPSKHLREQVHNDEILDPYVESLKARRDYYCNITDTNCKECSIYESDERSCANQGPACTYWARKQKVMDSPNAVITFPLLIIDSMLPTYRNETQTPLGDRENKTQISFGDREMVVVDEAHGIIQSTVEMHAGFDITPYGLPDSVFQNATDSVSFSANRFGDVEEEVGELQDRCEEFTQDLRPKDMNSVQKRCYRLMKKIGRAQKEHEEGKVWTVDVDTTYYGGQKHKTLHLKPVDVSSFLKNFVWRRGDKRVVSTATLPQRKYPQYWLQRIGLDPSETKIISVRMRFPVERRPVVLDEMVGRMSGDREDKHWDDVMETLNRLVRRHNGTNGICHASSYSRAERVVDSIDDSYPYLQENVYLHEEDEKAREAVMEWQESNKSLIVSPSMMEGVDLKDDMARYNILLKVPYPQRDSRTEYILNETDYGWPEYFSRTAVRVAQAYGRTTRSAEDWSTFYVLDEDYNKLKKRAQFPEWLLEAEGGEPLTGRSLMEF